MSIRNYIKTCLMHWKAKRAARKAFHILKKEYQCFGHNFSENIVTDAHINDFFLSISSIVTNHRLAIRPSEKDIAFFYLTMAKVKCHIPKLAEGRLAQYQFYTNYLQIEAVVNRIISHGLDRCERPRNTGV